ncbi:hypothetical protein L1049_017712 [Liquidambar formosana]|uniref:DUF4283 domain-containing protein n=1 Tax=Liquidambar formosana TaxID=63359 RepID=A0AAP0X7I4_LIQFO
MNTLAKAIDKMAVGLADLRNKSFLQAARGPYFSLRGECKVEAQANRIVFKPYIKDVESRTDLLKTCLVGRFEGFGGSLFDIEIWAAKTWGVTTGVKVHIIPDGLLLFCFPFEEESLRVLNVGGRHKGEAMLQLDR